MAWSQKFRFTTGLVTIAKGVREGVGLKTPIQLDILQKLYYRRKGE